MDSSKTVEDDTIRDQMESGSVAARPRFTRARRAWKINARNLQAEDLRALDEFFMVTTARGGNSFLYPNLLPNSSFEFAATEAGDLVWGWSQSEDVAELAVAVTTAHVADGVQALGVSTVAGQNIPASTTVTAEIACDRAITCTPGEVYLLNAQLYYAGGTLPSGVLTAAAQIAFIDGNGNPLSTLTCANASLAAGWNAYNPQITIPANAAQMTVGFVVTLSNTGSGAISLDGSTTLAIDSVGCALMTPLTPYGRMAGSAPLGCLVRFSALPETSDIGFGGGVKRYGAHFELQEV